MKILDAFKKSHDEEKIENDFLPNKLKIGSLVNFKEKDFRNRGLKSKFIFEGFNNIVQAVSEYEVDGIKHANVYLESQNEVESYLTLVYAKNGEEIESCRLFKLYDEVFPDTEEEWLYWLGNEAVSGIISDETFIIEDEPIEKIGELLYKLTKNLYPKFNSFMESDFDDCDSCISTNLFYRISEELGLGYESIVSKFDKELSKCDWIVEVVKSDDDNKIVEIYFVLTESDLDIEYTNHYKKDDAFDYDEKIYSAGSSEIPIIVSKKTMLFHRKIEEEYFEEEYILINVIEDGQGTHIALDIGIPIDVSLLEL